MPSLTNKPAPSGPDPLLDVPGVAATFGLTERTVRELFNRRALDLVRIGRRLYVRTSAVDAYLDANRVPAKR